MKRLFAVLVATGAILASSGVVNAEEKKDEKKPDQRQADSELVGTLSSTDSVFYTRRTKEGELLLYKLKRKLTEQQVATIKADLPDGDTKANAALQPGFGWERRWLGHSNHVFIGPALNYCTALATQSGCARSEVVGFSRAWECYGICAWRPLPPPVPFPWPYGADAAK